MAQDPLYGIVVGGTIFLVTIIISVILKGEENKFRTESTSSKIKGLKEKKVKFQEKISDSRHIEKTMEEIRMIKQYHDISSIKGVSPINVKKLNSINIFTVSQLLEAGETFEGVLTINKRTGIYSKKIDEWVKLGDFSRIQGITQNHIELLGAANVSRVKDLAQKIPQELHLKLVELNKDSKFCLGTPTLGMVTRWIRIANTLTTPKEQVITRMRA
ncbi:MAG: DUF4332 domain-containing protein [Promethearchaeota archaeon]